MKNDECRMKNLMEGERKKADGVFFRNLVKVALPLLLGAFVLYWVYRDFDFAQAARVLRHGVRWEWMILSLCFGVWSHVERALRWRQMLEPLGCRPRPSHVIDAVYLSYATSLVVPRVGEVSRCGVLARHDGVPFSKSLGTVVTERLVDALCVLLITGVTLLLQLPVFLTFFHQTGTKIPSLIHLFTSPWFYVSLFCVVGVVVVLIWLARVLSFFERVRGVVLGVWQGIMSLRRVRSVPSFLLHTALMWLCYFLHFYLTFYCFPFTSSLGVEAGLVMFVAGTFAVIVPTPNGAGPWHFAVITMMMLYGVSSADAALFALLVHGIQTLLVIVLGLWGWLHLVWGGKRNVPSKKT